MRAHTIGILLSSPLLSAGVMSVLRSSPHLSLLDLDRNASLLDELNEGRSSTHISAIVADIHTAQSCPEDIPVILIADGLLPDCVSKRFGAVVSIYDGVDVLTEKIKTIISPTRYVEQRGEDLSPREKDVLKGVVKGLSNKEIATEMGVSVNTVMTHRRNIASKLEIHSPAGLTIFAIATGIVKIEEVAIQ